MKYYAGQRITAPTKERDGIKDAVVMFPTENGYYNIKTEDTTTYFVKEEEITGAEAPRKALSGLNVVMFGNGFLGVPTLERLLDEGCKVSAVVSSPARCGKAANLNPLAECARAHGIDVVTDEGDPLDLLLLLSDYAPDIMVVASYKKLPAEICALAPLGAVGLHPSLLPSFRGASPVQTAIARGCTTMGVTAFRLTDALDGGPVLANLSVTYDYKTSSGNLMHRLAAAGAGVVAEALRLLLGGWEGVSQDVLASDITPPSVTHKLRPTDFHIEWDAPAQEVLRRILSLSPRPGARAEVRIDGTEDIRAVKIITARKTKAKLLNYLPLRPGTAFKSHGNLYVTCADAPLWIGRLVEAGHAPVTGADYANAHLH